MEYREIVEIIGNNPTKVDFGDFGEGVSEQWIKLASERLEVNFPPSYVWWLKNYGGGEINGEEVFSIYEIDFEEVVGGDIVYVHELNKVNYSPYHNKLAIQENDQGEMYYFNLEKVDPNGEYAVYIDTTEEEYASNFLDFLRKKIEE